MMQIVRARPPLFDLIDAKFNILGKPILFSWGTRIFIPTGNLEISAALRAHEEVHGARQLAYSYSAMAMAGDRKLTDLDPMKEKSITQWWLRYIADIDFRRDEEVLAHRAEYRHLCDHAGGRNQRRRHLSIVATRLSHPLYGPMMNKAAARKALTDGDAANP